MEGVKVQPFRSLDDFLLNRTRFKVPNFSDVKRWSNRVNNNLKYYQTNYLVLFIVIFFSFGAIYPAKQIILGASSFVVVFIVYNYLSNHRAEINEKQPLIGLAAIFAGAYLTVSMMDSMILFMSAILLPVSVVFIHASLRMQRSFNKVQGMVNKIEGVVEQSKSSYDYSR